MYLRNLDAGVDNAVAVGVDDGVTDLQRSSHACALAGWVPTYSELMSRTKRARQSS